MSKPVAVFHLVAPNSPSGNPRRLYLVVYDSGDMRAFDEGHVGFMAVPPEAQRLAQTREVRVEVTFTTYRDLLVRFKDDSTRTNPPGGQVRKNPGRFSSKLDEWVYILSLDGPDEELGDVGGFGYYALLENIEAEDVLRAAESVGDDEQDVRKFYLHELKDVAGGRLRDAGDFAAIVHVDNDGFVYVDYCRVGRDVRDTWQAIERDYEEYEQSEEEDA